jgi:hypothetical protein
MARLIAVLLYLCSSGLAFARDGAPVRTVHPKESARAFRNPGKGWVACVPAPAGPFEAFLTGASAPLAATLMKMWYVQVSSSRVKTAIGSREGA